MSIRVLRPGLFTTLQDLGRTGLQQYGVIVGGAMDPLALRIANLLVANDEGEAALEITLSGPSLVLDRDSLIAITGGELSPTIDGQPVPAWRPVWIRGGSRLDFGAKISGCRAYLSVSGGFDVPLVLHSRSTCLRGKFGGFQGRPLQTGDTLPLRPPSRRATERTICLANEADGRPFQSTSWYAGSDLQEDSNNPVIRVVAGGQFDWFPDESRQAFFSEEFQVTPQSDRMGYRLAGPPLAFRQSRELLSEAVTMGTVQVPPNGQPILLMADRPTTGGYAKIAQVVTVDLPILAQVLPGSRIRFQAISLAQAQDLYRSREAMIQRLRCGINLKDRE